MAGQEKGPLTSRASNEQDGQSKARVLNDIDNSLPGVASKDNTTETLEIEACFCHWNLDGTSQCRDPEEARFELLDFAFAICVTSKTDGVTFTQVQDFGYIQGTQREVLHAEGKRAMVYFGASWGVGTNRVILDGDWGSNEASFNNDNFMWVLFKRSIRALRDPNLEFFGTLVADFNGTLQNVPFQVNIPVARFRPGPFLSKKPSFFIAGANNKAEDGFETRRYGFALLCIFAVAAVGFAVRDLFLLFQLIRWACCRTKSTKSEEAFHFDVEYGQSIQESDFESRET